MCFAHEDGAREAWQSYDITPPVEANAKVTTFDVTESSTHIVLAIGISVGSAVKVYTDVCKKADFNPSGSVYNAHYSLQIVQY